MLDDLLDRAQEAIAEYPRTIIWAGIYLTFVVLPALKSTVYDPTPIQTFIGEMIFGTFVVLFFTFPFWLIGRKVQFLGNLFPGADRNRFSQLRIDLAGTMLGYHPDRIPRDVAVWRNKLNKHLLTFGWYAPALALDDATIAKRATAACASHGFFDFEIVRQGTTAFVRFWTIPKPDPTAGTRLVAGPRAGTQILGRSKDDGSNVLVDVADAWHTAIQGSTRSGKSVLMYGWLSQLSNRDDVLVCGIDPSRMLLGPWEDRYLANDKPVRIVTGLTDTDRIKTVMERLVSVMDDRITDLRRAGVDKLTKFTSETPVLLVVMEEYPGLLSALKNDDSAEGRRNADAIAAKVERAVGRLVKEGAKVGVRVILLAQRMSANAVNTDDRSNFGTRITLRVDNGDAVRMLHDGIDAESAAEVRSWAPGYAYIETPGDALRIMKADTIDYGEYVARVNPSGAPTWRSDD